MNLIQGRTLPEAFYYLATLDRKKEFYFSKRDGRWIGRSYQSALEFIFRTMAGLRALNFGEGDRIGILSQNREEWLLTDYAAQWLGGATVGIYTTNTAEQIRYIIDESEMRVLFVGSTELLDRLQEIRELRHLKFVVPFDPVDGSAPAGAKWVSYREFYKSSLSEDETVAKLNDLKPENLCLLLYTSGTTGEPKGVMLTQKSIMTNIRNMMSARESLHLEEDLLTLSFLPLSHIYERCVHNIFLLVGMKIHFAESMDKLLSNIQEIRPEVLNSVPRIFEKMYARIHDQIKNASRIRKLLFGFCLWVGRRTFSYRYRRKPLPLGWLLMYSIADVLVFRKIRAITGGRSRVFISGGAPLSQEVAEFFFSAGFTILEGYGLSEACILSVNRSTWVKFGTVGLPFQGIEVKVAEDGELLFRSDQIMKGYFKKPQETAEVLDEEGWLHTGDIGEIDSDGFIKITDRKKDLIVTAGGKKVAPQPIENVLKADSLIEMACVVGDKKKYVVALILPNLETCINWAHFKGLPIKTLKDCAASAELRQHFQKEIDRVNRELPPFSTIKDFRIVDEVFSQEGGELTPTLKLKRKVVQERRAKLINSMYDEEI